DDIGLAATSPVGPGFTFQWGLTSAPPQANGSFSDPFASSTRFHVVARGSYGIKLVVTDLATGAQTLVTTAVVVDDTAPLVALSNDAFVSAPGAPVTIAATARDVDVGDTVGFAWTLVSSPAGSLPPTLDG